MEWWKRLICTCCEFQVQTLLSGPGHYLCLVFWTWHSGVMKVASQRGSRLFYPQLRFLVSSFMKATFPLERRAHRGFWWRRRCGNLANVVFGTGVRVCIFNCGSWPVCNGNLWCELGIFLKKNKQKKPPYRLMSIEYLPVISWFSEPQYETLQGLFHDCSCDLTVWSK